MNLELRHLKVVCAIADTGSVTKASAQLGLAQPALTAQLQRIERALGGPLFERDRRGARPTALGELVLSRARVLLPAVKGLQDDAARLAGSGSAMSRCRIGAVNGPIVGGLVHRLRADIPETPITTYASWSEEELIDMVCTGRLDYAVIGICGDNVPASNAMAWRTIATDAVFVLLPQWHPLASQDEVDLAELSDAQWTVTPGDGCFWDCFAAACARAGFTPHSMYETDVRGCVELVESGVAVGLCQGSFRRVEGLEAVPIKGAPLRWRHMLGWHPESAAAIHASTVAEHALASYLDAAVARNSRYAAWLSRNLAFGGMR